jgi:hypothetical protein
VARLAVSPVNLLGTSPITLGSSGTALAANTGVSFTNNGLMFLAVYIGSSGAGNLTFNIGRTVEGQVPVVADGLHRAGRLRADLLRLQRVHR